VAAANSLEAIAAANERTKSPEKRAAFEQAAKQKAARAARAAAYGLTKMLADAGIDTVGDEVVQRAIEWCEENSTTHVDEIVKFDAVDEFVAALQLKSLPGKKLRAHLQPAANQASQVLESHRAHESHKPRSPPPAGGGMSLVPLREGPVPATPFKLQTTFPPIIFSYCTKTDGGLGEEHVWRLANFLKDNGIHSFNGKQVDAGEDWMQKWLGKMPEASVCIAMLSPEYFKSGPCKEEIYAAAREGLTILPVIFEKPPELKRGFFGKSDEDREKGNFVRQKLGNWLPTPDKGLFQDNWAANLQELLAQVRKSTEDLIEEVD